MLLVLVLSTIYAKIENDRLHSQSDRNRHEYSLIDLSRILTNNGTESRLGWTKIQQMYENVHPNLALVLWFVRTEVECGKGLLITLQDKVPVSIFVWKKGL